MRTLDEFMSCPCGRGDYQICQQCPYNWCSVHGRDAPHPPITQHVVQWAAAECERQPECTPASVARMVNAWAHAAHLQDQKPTVIDVRVLARKVEPKTGGDYRCVPVIFPSGQSGAPPGVIPGALARLVEYQPPIGYEEEAPGLSVTGARFTIIGANDALRWYKDFEEIHPFINGNGRVGSILYNWLRGTLLEPVTPPDMWRKP